MTAAAIAIAEMLNSGNKSYLHTFYLWQRWPAHLHTFNLCGGLRIFIFFILDKAACASLLLLSLEKRPAHLYFFNLW